MADTCSTDWPAFIRANALQLTPALVPEIKLHLAAESLPIWQKTEDELGRINMPPPYWAFAWAGGQALARYLIDTPEIVLRRAVLDLGCGSGLTAIASMLAGATSVLAADIDHVALEAVRINAQINGVTVQTTPVDLLAAPPGSFDVILVGDLFYEKSLAERVLDFIDAARRQGAVVLIGDPQRSYFPRGRFERVVEYRVPVSRELEDADVKHTVVWRVP